MPKVKHVKARKDYPEAGIKRGDMYYTTSIKTGPYSSRTLRQKTMFKRSQLTTSDFLSQMYDIEDDLAALSSIDDVQDLIDRLETLGEETQAKLDNMPEGLQQGSTGEQLQSRIDGCENAKQELENILSECGDDYDTRNEEWTEEKLEEFRQVSIDYQ